MKLLNAIWRWLGYLDLGGALTSHLIQPSAFERRDLQKGKPPHEA